MLRKLSNKEKKDLLKNLEEIFGFTKKLEYNFFINENKRIFIFNRDIEIDFSKLRVNSMGLYFANHESELRLTIEGSQILGPYSKKNILEIDEKTLEEWIYGKDISSSKEFNGFVIIKNNNDFYGTGKYKNGIILNHIPKERRLKL